MNFKSSLFRLPFFLLPFVLRLALRSTHANVSFETFTSRATTMKYLGRSQTGPHLQASLGLRKTAGEISVCKRMKLSALENTLRALHGVFPASSYAQET